MRSLRGLCVHTLAAVALVTLALSTGPAYPQARRGGTLNFALYQEPELLNTYIGTQTALGEVTIFTVEGLVDYNEKGEYFPRLATEVPTRQNGGVSADGKSITYHLKEGLKWSNGQAVTCEDVKFTWQAVTHPKSSAVYTSGFRDIDRVECPTPTTVVVVYKKFYAPYLDQFTRGILPKHATGDPAEMTRWAYNRKPVGTGPFVMLEWVSGDHITLIRNRFYREAPKPFLNAVIIRVTPSREVGTQLIKTGEVDIVWDLIEANVPELRPVAGVKISAASGPGAERLLLNLADPALDGPPADEVAKHPHPILGDVRVREAIELGINKKEINDSCCSASPTPGPTNSILGGRSAQRG